MFDRDGHNLEKCRSVRFMVRDVLSLRTMDGHKSLAALQTGLVCEVCEAVEHNTSAC